MQWGRGASSHWTIKEVPTAACDWALSRLGGWVEDTEHLPGDASASEIFQSLESCTQEHSAQACPLRASAGWGLPQGLSLMPELNLTV